MDAKSYFERFAGADGRAVIDPTTYIDQPAAGILRLVSAHGTLLIQGFDQIDSAVDALKGLAVTALPAAEFQDDDPEEADADDADAPLSPQEFDAMVHDGESVRGAWPASDDGEPGHFEDTVGELEENRMYGQVDDESEE